VWTLNVQCAEHAFVLSLPPHATVGALRACIAAAEPLRGVAGARDARLIFAGRLLADASATLAAAGLADGAHVQVALGVRPGSGVGAGAAAAAAAAAWGGAGGGTGAGTGGVVGGAAAAAPLAAARGFDRLALLGLDADGIALMRAQFLAEVIAADLAQPRHLPGETEAERLLRNEVRRRAPPRASARGAPRALTARHPPPHHPAPADPGRVDDCAG